MQPNAEVVADIICRTETDAVLFDCGMVERLGVTGPDAARFLHNLCTNDIVSLKHGTGCLAYFCDRLAKVRGQARIYYTTGISTGINPPDQHLFTLDVPPGSAVSLHAHLDKHLISERVEFSDPERRARKLHLAGPRSLEILQNMFGVNEPKFGPKFREWPEYQHQLVTPAECLKERYSVFVRRNDYLGILGFDIDFDAVATEAVDYFAWDSGCLAKPEEGGDLAFEILRIQACTPVFGKDIDDKRFVMEVADAAKTVSYSKGCYLGQEPIVMSRDRAGFVNRAMKLVESVETAGNRIPGRAKLYRDGKVVGETTASVTEASTAWHSIAIAYIQRGHQEPGTRLTMEASEGQPSFEVEIAEPRKSITG